MGAGIREGDPCGAHKPPKRAQGLWACGPMVLPPGVFSLQKNLEYSTKDHTKFSGHLENFYFRDIFYCTNNSENRQIIVFLLYLF